MKHLTPPSLGWTCKEGEECQGSKEEEGVDCQARKMYWKMGREGEEMKMVKVTMKTSCLQMTAKRRRMLILVKTTWMTRRRRSRKSGRGIG